MRKLTTILILILLSACTSSTRNPQLEGAWKLITLNDTTVLASSPTAFFGPDGEISGLTGCNHYSGRFSLRGRSMTIEQLMVTEMACFDQEIMAREDAFLKAIQAVQIYELQGDTLTLNNNANSERLVFARANP